MTLNIATQNRAALELTGKIAANPALAKPLLQLLKQLGEDVEKLNALDLSVLTTVQEALPKSHLLTELTLRAEDRIQDRAVILAKLGFQGNVPSIPQEILEECARTNGTLVLKFKTRILDYQANLNAALGPDNEHLHLYSISDRAKSLATHIKKPTWVNVPNTVKVDTLGMSKVDALNYMPNSTLCNPMDIVLMLGYNNLQTGEQLAGFTNRGTFTNQKNTVVHSDGDGIAVIVDACYDGAGSRRVGLAPRLAPGSTI